MKVPVLQSLGFTADMTFTEFVRLVHSLPDDQAEKHIMSQHFLFDSQHYGSADRLLRFETLGDGWNTLRQEFPFLPELGHYKKTVVEKPEWTTETVDLVAERYEKDIEALGYEAP